MIFAIIRKSNRINKTIELQSHLIHKCFYHLKIYIYIYCILTENKNLVYMWIHCNLVHVRWVHEIFVLIKYWLDRKPGQKALCPINIKFSGNNSWLHVIDTSPLITTCTDFCKALKQSIEVKKAHTSLQNKIRNC